MAPHVEPARIVVNRHQWDGQAADMRSTLQTWDWRWQLCRTRGAAIIDFTSVEFMEPWALTLFTCFALRLKHEGVDVSLELDESNPANRYLRMMGIESVVDRGASCDRWDADNRNTGLHLIRSHQDVTRFIASAAALGSAPGQDVLDALRYGMAELGRNVVQHAASSVGGVAIAQHFPDRRAIQVAICDCGRGLLDSLRGNYPELRGHLESLKLAVLPHSSGAAPPGPYGTTENAGLGLFFCKEICWRTGGSFWLASYDAMIGIHDNDSRGQGRVYRRISPWEGTLVTMHLPQQDIVAFDDLLALCRDLSSQARRDGGAAALDFADDLSEIPPDLPVVEVGKFVEDVEAAAAARDGVIRPALADGRIVVLDFGGARFVTQSFAQALLYDVFRTPGSLTKLIFRRCTRGTQESVRLVAAYAGSYRQQSL